MRRLHLMFAFLPFMLGVSVSWAADAPEFSSYPAEERWNGSRAKLVRNSDFARSYRTRLREAAQGGPNFARHYSVTVFGCGSGGCIIGGVVDLHTGVAIEFPQTTTQSLQSEDVEGAGVRYDIDSKLIVFRGFADEGDYPVANAYVLENGAFRLVSSVPLDLKIAEDAEKPGLTFRGYDCSGDCSGHEAGYDRAERQGITSVEDCTGNSQSFIEGCMAYVDAQE